MSIGCSIKSRHQKVKTMSKKKEKARLKRLKEFKAAQVKYLESAGWQLVEGEGWINQNNGDAFITGNYKAKDIDVACKKQLNKDLLDGLKTNVAKECKEYMTGLDV